MYKPRSHTQATGSRPAMGHRRRVPSKSQKTELAGAESGTHCKEESHTRATESRVTDKPQGTEPRLLLLSLAGFIHICVIYIYSYIFLMYTCRCVGVHI